MNIQTNIVVAALACCLILPTVGVTDKTKQSTDENTTINLTPGDQADQETTSPDQSSAVSGATAGEEINWQVMGGGGGPAEAGGYRINGTIGQPVAGWTAATGHSIHQGYWQNFMASGDCCQLPGDFNGDLVINVGDCVYLIYYLFRQGPPPPCLNEADVNVDCMVDLADIVWLINYIFKVGPLPQCGCAE